MCLVAFSHVQCMWQNAVQPARLLCPWDSPGKNTTPSSRESSWPRDQNLQGFPGGSDGKVSACNAGDPGSIPESGWSPGEGNGNALQHSCPENPMDGGAWQATVLHLSCTGRQVLHQQCRLYLLNSKSLLIYFMFSSVCMSIPTSLFIHPHLSLLVTVSSSSTSYDTISIL